MSAFYEVMEKIAEGNYYSPHLSEKQRRDSFDVANKRRAGRKTGRSTSARSGAILGGIGGGLVGLGSALENKVDPSLALLTGGIGAGGGYLIGRGVDKARDARTMEARDILKMSPKQRAEVLDYRKAERLDDYDEQEARHTAQRRSEKSELRRAKIRRLNRR